MFMPFIYYTSSSSRCFFPSEIVEIKENKIQPSGLSHLPHKNFLSDYLLRSKTKLNFDVKYELLKL